MITTEILITTVIMITTEIMITNPTYHPLIPIYKPKSSTDFASSFVPSNE